MTHAPKSLPRALRELALDASSLAAQLDAGDRGNPDTLRELRARLRVRMSAVRLALALVAVLVGCGLDPMPAPQSPQAGAEAPEPADPGGRREPEVKGVYSPGEPPEVHLVGYPLPTIEHVVAAWPADLLGESCMDPVTVSVVTFEEAQERCEKTAAMGDKVWGCFQVWKGGRKEIWVAVGPKVPHSPERIAAHEWAHHMYRCSGLPKDEDYNHGEQLFKDTIEGTLDVWHAERDALEPTPAPEGTCPAALSCQGGVCADTHAYHYVTGQAPCKPFTYAGVEWPTHAGDSGCVATCGEAQERKLP